MIVIFQQRRVWKYCRHKFQFNAKICKHFCCNALVRKYVCRSSMSHGVYWRNILFQCFFIGILKRCQKNVIFVQNLMKYFSSKFYANKLKMLTGNNHFWKIQLTTQITCWNETYEVKECLYLSMLQFMLLIFLYLIKCFLNNSRIKSYYAVLLFWNCVFAFLNVIIRLMLIIKVTMPIC